MVQWLVNWWVNNIINNPVSFQFSLILFMSFVAVILGLVPIMVSRFCRGPQGSCVALCPAEERVSLPLCFFFRESRTLFTSYWPNCHIPTPKLLATEIRWRLYNCQDLLLILSSKSPFLRGKFLNNQFSFNWRGGENGCWTVNQRTCHSC